MGVEDPKADTIGSLMPFTMQSTKPAAELTLEGKRVETLPPPRVGVHTELEASQSKHCGKGAMADGAAKRRVTVAEAVLSAVPITFACASVRAANMTPEPMLPSAAEVRWNGNGLMA